MDIRGRRGAFLGLLFFLAGCVRDAGPAQDGIVFRAEFNPSKPRVGRLVVTVTLRDSSGHPVEGALLSLEGNMSHAGMRPVLGEARPIRPGIYTGNLELNMAGDWFVRVWGDLEDGRTFDRTVPLPGVRPQEE